MEVPIQAGSIVRSVQGRDFGTVYAVLSVQTNDRGSVCLVANGEERKIARPKAKNPRHLQLVCEDKAFTDPKSLTDAELRKALHAYRPLD